MNQWVSLDFVRVKISFVSENKMSLDKLFRGGLLVLFYLTISASENGE